MICELWGQKFDAYDSVQRDLLRLVDDSHGSLSDLTEYLITGESSPAEIVLDFDRGFDFERLG